MARKEAKCCQDIQRCQRLTEVLAVMAEVVLQVVALGFEGVVVFILNLPSGPSGSNNLSDGVIADAMTGGKSVMVGHLTIGAADR